MMQCVDKGVLCACAHVNRAGISSCIQGSGTFVHGAAFKKLKCFKERKHFIV